MSKLRTLLGGLAAIGMLSALAVSGVLSASATTAHVPALRAVAVSPDCLTCGLLAGDS